MKILDYEDRESVNEKLSQFDTDDDKKLSKEEFIKLLSKTVNNQCDISLNAKNNNFCSFNGKM